MEVIIIPDIGILEPSDVDIVLEMGMDMDAADGAAMSTLIEDVDIAITVTQWIALSDRVLPGQMDC